MSVHEEIRIEINFDKIFNIMVNSMWLIKSHPWIPRNVKWVFQFSIMHGIFFFTYCLLIYSTINHDLKNGDLAQACANGVLSVFFNVVSIKYMVLVRHQTHFRNMIEKIKQDYVLAKHLPFEEYQIVLNYAKKGRQIVNIWLVVGIGAASVFPVKSIVLMLYYGFIGEFKYFPLYNITYPEFVEVRKNEVIVFLTLYALFLFYLVYAMIMYLAFSPLGPILILHACGQLELVERRISNIFSESNRTDDAVQNLKLAAKQLTEIYKFVEKANICLKIYHELIFKAVAIILPIIFYQVIEASKKGIVSFEFISVIFGAAALCNVPCYYGDMLLQKSEDVRMALYSCGWEYHYERKSRSLIFLLLTRAVRPVAMRTVFRNISLDALTDIYQQAYGLLNLLYAVWN